ncbi:MAG: PilW family protein [Pseudomonadota bacterium]
MKIKSQQGMTLVELMIAMVLGFIILYGVIQVFMANRHTSRLQESLSRIQENGRIAITTVARELRNADYWGCTSDATRLQNHVAKTDEENFIPHDLGVDGEDGTTDKLSIRGAVSIPNSRFVDHLGQDYPIDIGFNDAAAFINKYLDASQVLLISDCEQGDLFVANAYDKITNVVALGHDNANNETIFSCSTGNHCLSRKYGPDALIYKPYSVDFYVNNNTLYRKDNTDSQAQPIANGVANIQFLYGVDNNDDYYADYYQSRTSVADMSKVVSVKVHLLLETEEAVAESPQSYLFNWEETFAANTGSQIEELKIQANDKKIRREFSTTVALRNRI